MIYEGVSAIASQLNQSLRRGFQLDEDLLVVSNLTEPDGSLVTQAANRLVMFLVNIERDATAYQPSGYTAGGGSRFGLSQPAMHINVYVMFAATFSGTSYPEALKFISHTMAFFQGKPLFDRGNSPELDSRIERLVMEMENLSINDLSNLWGILRGTYLPSVLYRMRMLTIDAGALTAQVPFARQPDVGAKARHGS